jgi:3-hydroxyisobutyrate dehydrogenase-like beta-hydroxyacid dehydrogenase
MAANTPPNVGAVVHHMLTLSPLPPRAPAPGMAATTSPQINKALEAINGSSGRSWVTMQRFPDNILTADPYGFALGMHCKDMENAMDVVRADRAAAPMLELARCLMHIGQFYSVCF